MASDLQFDALPEIRRFVAERIYLHNRQAISNRELALDNAEIRADILAYNADELLLTLTAYIHGMTNEKISVHKRWPRTWWDALKERWFPKWALKRWPANYESIDIDQQIYLAVCPHLHDPQQGHHLEWLAVQQLRHEAQP